MSTDRSERRAKAFKQAEHGMLLRGAGGRITFDAAVAQAHDAPGVIGDVGLVGDDDERMTARVQFVEQMHDLLAGTRIEIARRFVGEDQRGLSHQCAGDGDALALAARELVGTMMQAVGEADAGERIASPVRAASPWRMPR